LYVLYSKVIETLRAQFETIFNKLNFLDRMEMMKQFFPLALLFGVGLCFFTSYFTSRHQIRKISIR
ncbi:MAG: ABC transporter permease, partial [Lachnospiraceae bacterium]